MSKHEAGVWQAASFWKLKSSDMGWNGASFLQRFARSEVMIWNWLRTGFK